MKINEITLLICAKNELENLKLHFQNWRSQKGIISKIIIVNDNSTDGSKEWLDEQSGKFNQLKVLHLEAHDGEKLRGKRFALFKGISLITTDYVVLTDADCYSRSTHWLRIMADGFKEHTEIVLGYSSYKTENNLLGKLIDYETILTALQYLSFAKIRMPYMGVGRNIAYKTSLLKKKNFIKSNRSIGGDDDLLVATLANKVNTEITIDKESFVYTLPEKNFKEWKRQKVRHYSTGKYYKFINFLMTGGFGALNLLFYITLGVIILVNFNFLTLLILYLLKQFLFVVTNYKNLKHFELNNIIYRIWYIDFLFIIVFLFFHLSSLLTFKDVWIKK